MTLEKVWQRQPISDVPKEPRQSPFPNFASNLTPQLHPQRNTASAASTMPALANATRAIARSWTQHSLPVARAGCTAVQSRSISGSEVHSTSSFDSPFKGQGSSTKIPSFGAYKRDSKGGEEGPKLIQYFMVGTMGALASLGAKATVQGISTPHQEGAPESVGTKSTRALDTSG